MRRNFFYLIGKFLGYHKKSGISRLPLCENLPNTWLLLEHRPSETPLRDIRAPPSVIPLALYLEIHRPGTCPRHIGRVLLALGLSGVEADPPVRRPIKVDLGLLNGTWTSADLPALVGRLSGGPGCVPKSLSLALSPARLPTWVKARFLGLSRPPPHSPP